MGQDELAVTKPDPAQAKGLGPKQPLETGREVGKGRKDGWACIFPASSSVFPKEGNSHSENDHI